MNRFKVAIIASVCLNIGLPFTASAKRAGTIRPVRQRVLRRADNSNKYNAKLNDLNYKINCYNSNHLIALNNNRNKLITKLNSANNKLTNIQNQLNFSKVWIKNSPRNKSLVNRAKKATKNENQAEKQNKQLNKAYKIATKQLKGFEYELHRFSLSHDDLKQAEYVYSHEVIRKRVHHVNGNRHRPQHQQKKQRNPRTRKNKKSHQHNNYNNRHNKHNVDKAVSHNK